MAELQTALADFGIWILFVLAMVEGPLVVLGATALSQVGAIPIHLVWSVAVLADLAGDLLLYTIGRFLPGLLPHRYLPQMAQERAGDLFRHSGPRILVMAKLTHFAGLPTLVGAGYGRMPILPFLLWNLGATILKVTAIVLAGWFFWQTVISGDTSDVVALLVGLGLCSALILLLFWGRRWLRP